MTETEFRTVVAGRIEEETGSQFGFVDIFDADLTVVIGAAQMLGIEWADTSDDGE